jgi:hypothetical protein
MQTSDAAVKRMEEKSNEITDCILEMIKSNGITTHGDNSTPRKNVDIDMHDTTAVNPITPASHENHTHRGMDTSTGERS